MNSNACTHIKSPKTYSTRTYQVYICSKDGRIRHFHFCMLRLVCTAAEFTPHTRYRQVPGTHNSQGSVWHRRLVWSGSCSLLTARRDEGSTYEKQSSPCCAQKRILPYAGSTEYWCIDFTAYWCYGNILVLQHTGVTVYTVFTIYWCYSIR